MIFRVCEHYDDKEPIVEEQYNVCFICFEYKIDNENKPTNLQKQSIYLNNCFCNGAVHNYCLKIWCDKNNSCPICRVNVIKNNNITMIIYHYIPWGIKIYIFIKKVSIIFLKFLSFMLFFYALIDFYLVVIRQKYVPYNDYTYIPSPILENEYVDI